MDENCNYVVNEPLTTPDSDHAKVVGEEKRKASGNRRRYDYRVTLPSSTESEKGKLRILIGPRTRKTSCSINFDLGEYTTHFEKKYI